MASNILFLAIFYASILSISGQIIRDDIDDGIDKGNNTMPTEDHDTSDHKVRPHTPNNLYDEYMRVCNRSDIENSKLICDRKGGKKPSNETTHAVMEQNKVILEYLIHSYIRPKVIPDFEPIHGFKILAKTVEIYKKFCPDVPISFINRTEYIFKVLNYRFASTRMEFFQEVEKHTTWIHSILEKCLSESQPKVFMMNSCKEMILGTKGHNASFICTDPTEETNYKAFDPVMDSIWSIINAIRAGCFKYFHGSYYMWHLYFTSLLDTFAPNVQIRWNAQIEDLKFWTHVLGSRFLVDLANMEKCSKVIVADSDLHGYGISIARGQFVSNVRLGGVE